MATQQDLAAYVASVRGLYIDVDRVFGAQCWDQMSHYMQWYGVPAWPTYTNAGGTWPHGGYACNVYHNAASAGLTNYFDVLPADAAPRAGDIAFWEYGTAYYPWSHVSTVLEVTHGGRMLRCLTQNPGAVQIADLIINGLIGYLRPRALNVGNVDASKSPSLSASEKEESTVATHYIAKIDKPSGRQFNAIFNTQSGFFHEFESKDGEYNTNILKTFGVAYPSSIVTPSHYDAVKRDCAATRAGK